jgi:D-alanyl-D-alanine carboxypeptidase
MRMRQFFPFRTSASLAVGEPAEDRRQGRTAPQGVQARTIVVDRGGKRHAHTIAFRAAFWLLAALVALPAFAAPFAAVVMDARNGRVLHAQNADARLHPASLTKMMTLYVAFDAIRRGEISLDTMVTVSAKAAAEPPSRLGLRAGQRISMRNLIRAAALRSANDAATAIAEAISGSEAAFARRMTAAAGALGMTRTTFRNAHGLTEAGHLSTARDMTILGRRLFFDFPEHYALFARRSADAGVATVANTNRRFLESYRGADGIKTGFTRAAGFNLTASAERGGKRLVATVFGGTSTAHRNARMAELLDLGFAAAPARVAVNRPPAVNLPTDGGVRGTDREPARASAKTIRLVIAPARSPRPQPRPLPGPAAPAGAAALVAEAAGAVPAALAAAVAEAVDAGLRDALAEGPAPLAEGPAPLVEGPAPLAEGPAPAPRPRPAAPAAPAIAAASPPPAPAPAAASAEPAPAAAAGEDPLGAAVAAALAAGGADTSAAAAPAGTGAARGADAAVAVAAAGPETPRPLARDAGRDDAAAVSATAAAEPAAAPAAVPAAVPAAAPADAVTAVAALAAAPPAGPAPDADTGMPAGATPAPPADLLAELPAELLADLPRPGEDAADLPPLAAPLPPAPRAAAPPPIVLTAGEVGGAPPAAAAAGEVSVRFSTSGGRYWSVTLGSFPSRGTAERALLQTGLAEPATLGTALRKVVARGGRFEAMFHGLPQEAADLACRRLAARAIGCFTVGP